MLSSTFISITVNLGDRLWRQSDKVIPQQRSKIIQFAEEQGNRAAQREFEIAESNVHLWRPKKIFRKCQDFNVPIVEEKQLGLDSNKI